MGTRVLELSQIYILGGGAFIRLPAGSPVRIGFLRSHVPSTATNQFAARLFCLCAVSFGLRLFIEAALGHSACVAHIEKQQFARVLAGAHPGRERWRFCLVGMREGSAIMCAPQVNRKQSNTI